MEMPDLGSVFQGIKAALDATKTAIEVTRSLKGSARTDQQEAALEAALQEAENARQRAAAEIGKAFGYRLCRCTLPPQVCLRIGYVEYSGAEKSKCPRCGQVYPEERGPLPPGAIELE